jgi:hypothetical protein
MKLLYSVASAAIVFLVLWGLGALVSAYVVYAAFALTAGALVHTRVAMWEITRATGGLLK